MLAITPRGYPPTNLDKSKSPKARQPDYILLFTTAIRYIKEITTDTLSSADISTFADDIPSYNLMPEQKSNSKLKDELTNASLKLQKLLVLFSKQKKLNFDVTLNNPWAYIPPTLRKLFQYLHELSHPNKRATTKPIDEHFVWPNMTIEFRK